MLGAISMVAGLIYTLMVAQNMRPLTNKTIREHEQIRNFEANDDEVFSEQADTSTRKGVRRLEEVGNHQVRQRYSEQDVRLHFSPTRPTPKLMEPLYSRRGRI